MKTKHCIDCDIEYIAKTNEVRCRSCQGQHNPYMCRLSNKNCNICGDVFQGTPNQQNCKKCRRKRINVNYKEFEQNIICCKCGSILRAEKRKVTRKIIKSKKGGLCQLCVDVNRKKASERMMGLNNPTVIKNGGILKVYPSKMTPAEVSAFLSERMKNNNPMKNPEIAKKVGDKNKGRHMPKGSNHGNWKGNRPRAHTIRTRLYPVWTFPNLQKANFCCEVCGVSGILEVHHESESFNDCLIRVLDGRDLKLLTDIEFKKFIDIIIEEHKMIKGLVVCPDCHRKVDEKRR